MIMMIIVMEVFPPPFFCFEFFVCWHCLSFSGGDHKLYLKDLSQDVIRKVKDRLRNDKTALKQICQSFGINIPGLYSWKTTFKEIIGMFLYTPVEQLEEVFEALQLYDLISLLEEGRPRVTRLVRPALRLQEIEKLRNPDDRPISYHSSVAVLIIDGQETRDIEGIEEFFKGLNIESEVTVMSFGNVREKAEQAFFKQLVREHRSPALVEKAEDNLERELNKLRSTYSKVIQSWISNQGW